ELAEALQLGREKGGVDAILTSNLRKAQDEKELDITEEADFYATVRKNDETGKRILREINYAIEQMDKNEGDWKNELFYKYYGPVYSSSLSFTAREKAYLQQVVAGEKTITVTAFGNRAPYSYVENGELKGILPDYFSEIMNLAARAMGYDSLPYTFFAPAEAEDYARLADGVVNVVLDSVANDAIKEDEIVSCFNTKSYMTVRMARVTRQNHSGDIKTIAVSTSQGKTLIEPYINMNNYNVKTYDTGEEALNAVLKGNADVAYVYSYTAQYFINHGHADELYYSSVNGMLTEPYMHISKTTDHELLTILNKCIKQVRDDTLNQLASKYTSMTIDDMSFGEYLKAHPEIIIGVVFAIVVILGIIISLLIWMRWNKKLLNTTEQTNKKMAEQLAIVEALSRDYTNVFAVNEEKETTRILKLEGYVT
ncbi:MAG: transporter substrate-binding domain-containing protein, partial [Clostridia bacterium]|nr:transporter substrate-binding domain-containing protein [Clostridia bacterium]